MSFNIMSRLNINNSFTNTKQIILMKKLYRPFIQSNVLFTQKTVKNDYNYEEKILQNALKYVPQYGFTISAIELGSVEAGYSPASGSIFRNGAFDLINYFYQSSNKKVEKYLDEYIKEKQNKINIAEITHAAIKYRLLLIQPYIDHWPQAMSIMTFYPNNALQSIKNLFALCDEIWFRAGDKSTDFNWYTKRMTLGFIYKSTELFMIQDKSMNFEETWKFLDRRFDDVRRYAVCKKSLYDFKELSYGSLKVLQNVLNLR